jgi:opacity protein-like surface antigen
MRFTSGMLRRILGLAAAFGVAMAGMSAIADDLGTPIDLSSFDEVTSEASSSPAWDDVPLEEVARRFGTAPRRFYLSGMIGPSFATVTSPGDPTLDTSDAIFAAGGALGIAFERAHGRLRLEVEGMGRNTYDSQFKNPPRPNSGTVLTNNWSVMQNVWRDLMLTDSFGVYGGGGIGAGGYILGESLTDNPTAYVPPAAGFAWQAGGGVLWQITDRLTFDVGYRYFQIDTIQQTDSVFPNQFAASELMFTLRLYEPFRNWRR